MKIISKGILLFCLLFTFRNNNIFAQGKLGINAGLGLSYNSSTAIIETPHKPILSFHAGISYDIPLAPKVSIKPNLLFSTKGWKVEDDFSLGSIPSDSYTYHLSYIDLQILANIHLSEKINFFIGPEFGYLINTTTKPIRFQSASFKDLNIGLLAGLEFKITNTLGIYLKYIHSLTKLGTIVLTDQNGGSLGVAQYGRNINLQVGLVYYL